MKAGQTWTGLVALMLAAVLASCGGSDQSRVFVAAASSLTDVFAEMETQFEQANPKVDIVLNLAGSTLLREQILQGAPVGVFASANQSAMAAVEQEERLAGPARVFAHNRMVLMVPSENPAQVSGLHDLARPELLIGLCAEEVPCGDFAKQILESAGVSASVDTREVNVRVLSTKITAGEIDAGIVYATEAIAVSGAEALEIPDPHNVSAQYPIAVLEGSDNQAKAATFVEFVLSDVGRRILAAHGFVLP